MKYTCPCCGFKTLGSKPPGTFVICDVCNWEDDLVQFDDPDYEGGANVYSLRQAQHKYAKGYRARLIKHSFQKSKEWTILAESEDKGGSTHKPVNQRPNMSPSVYLYNESENGHKLYLGEISTLEGLSLYDNEREFRLTSFGATSYKNYGWATEDELPKFLSVDNAISFLKSEGDIGIVDFKGRIMGIGTFGSHDDGECHFTFKSKQACLSILRKAIPPQTRDLLINRLISNPGLYLTCSNKGVIGKYSSFDEYLSKIK